MRILEASEGVLEALAEAFDGAPDDKKNEVLWLNLEALAEVFVSFYGKEAVLNLVESSYKGKNFDWGGL